MSRIIRNRFLADLVVALYRKFYIVAAIVQAPDELGRQATILAVLRRFWSAMSEGRIEEARAILAADTQYWLADLPPRFLVPASD